MKALLFPLLLGACSAVAQTQSAPAASNTMPPSLPTGSNIPAGSAAFCLFPVPSDNGALRWVNLGIVQYVEARTDAVQITYGGGNFGSGFDVRIPVKSADEARAVLTRMRQTAEDCVRRPSNKEEHR